MADYRIHIFLASGAAGPSNQFGYPGGERHALLILLRQPDGSDHDWDSAANHATEAGWTDVSTTKGGYLQADALQDIPAESVSAYEDALEQGSSIIVYADAIADAIETDTSWLQVIHGRNPSVS